MPAVIRLVARAVRTDWPNVPPSSARMLKRLRSAAGVPCQAALSGAGGTREESSQTALR